MGIIIIINCMFKKNIYKKKEKTLNFKVKEAAYFHLKEITDKSKFEFL